MKAVLYESYRPPSVALHIREIVKPTPKDRQVLIKVRAASINAMDSRRFASSSLLARLMTGGWLKPKDTSMGIDVAGIVESVGENVTGFKPGDEVFGYAHGSFAEYALARESNLALKPANRSHEEAAAVPVAALTALQAIRFAGGIRAGQSVLIYGASGGVGMYAIQLAKASGAEVTAVCSTRNLDLARFLGADHVMDYAREDFARNGKRYDLIIAVNGYRSLFAYRRALKPQGVYVCAGGAISQFLQSMIFGKWLSQENGRTMRNMGIAKINQDDLAALCKLFKDGKIAPIIDRTYPLDKTVDAMQYIVEHHAQGKIIIQPS